MKEEICNEWEGNVLRFRRPKNMCLVGFFIHYHGDDNHFPQRAVLVQDKKIIKIIPRTSGDEIFDLTIWCGFCIEQGKECDFCLRGKGIPRCLKEDIFCLGGRGYSQCVNIEDDC
ncbi:MAG: hypothetical protein Q6363_005715 [Candidatus Njordarchaeota archaeon]